MIEGNRKQRNYSLPCEVRISKKKKKGKPKGFLPLLHVTCSLLHFSYVASEIC